MTARSSSDDPVARPAADAPPAPELQEAHDRLKATLEALPDILFVLDRDGRIYDFHTPHPELLYVPPERFLGRTMREVLPAPAADVVDAAIADAVAHGHHHGAVYPLATSVGERWFEISISAQGEPRTPAGRLVAIVRDITDRKESEDELEDAHAWLKATLQALPDILFVVDRDGRVLDYHAPRAEMMRIPPEHFLGKRIPEIVSEPSARTLATALERALAEGTQEGVVFSIPLPEGERWYEASIAVQGDPHSPDARFVAIVRDIHDRKRTEDALRESERRFAQTAQVSRAYVWEVDPSGLFTFISPVVEEILGYRPDEIVGRMRFYDFHPPEGREAFLAAAKVFFQTPQEVTGVENPNVAKDGRIVWVASSATPRFAPDGSFRGFRGVDIDITARKRAEDALRESEERFAQSARQSRTYLWEVDPDGLYTFVSPVVADVLGYRPDEIVGRMHFYDLFPPERRAEFRESVSATIARRESFRDYENPCLAKDGRVVWVITSAIPLLDAAGALRGYRGSDTDITERKRAEDALRESEAQRRAINDNVPGGLVYQIDTGPDGQQRRFTFISKGVERLHGLPVEEALRDAMAIYRQVAEEDRLRLAEEEARAVAALAPFSTEVRFRLPSGEIQWHHVASAPRRMPNGHLVWDGIELDITARKRTEEVLQESQLRWRALNDNLPGGLVYQIDSGPDGRQRRFTMVSRGVEQLHGLTVQQALDDPRTVYGQVLEEDQVRLAALEADAAATLTPLHAEVRVRMPSGEVRWRLFTSAPRRLPNRHLVWDGVEIDITERKRVEAALRESEARARAVHDNLPGGLVYQVDSGEDGRQRDVIFMSKGAERLHGVPAEEIMRDPSVFYRQFVAEDLPRVVALENQAIAAMAPFQAEARIRLPSGKIRWSLFASAPRRLPNRHVVWDGVEIDITERKRAEEALRTSETKYRLLHETMRDAFASADLEGRILETNPAFQLLTGYAAEELRGMDYRTLTPGKWRAAEAKIVAEQVLTRGYSDVYQKEYVRKDGAVVPVELRTVLIRDEDGRPVGMWASIRDISARLRVERALKRATGELERRVQERTAQLEASREALARSEAQFRQMTDIIQEVFWLIDARTGAALYVSPAFERIWGRPPRKDNPGLDSWLGSLHPEDRPRARDAFARGLAAGAFEPLEVRVLRPDGALRWIEVRGWPLQEGADRPLRVAGVMRDITERRRLEAEILHASEAERQRSGRDLHDSLGQALTGIGYLAEALREDLVRRGQPEAAEVERLAHLIEEAAGKAHAMARGLLLVDLKRGGLAPALQELAFRTQELFGLACRYDGLAEVDLPDPEVAGQLYRIAQEATTNAAKHSGGSDIRISLADEPGGLRLAVRDDGRGLSGTAGPRPGMGLEIMRYRAGLIGAEFWIDGAPGRGTTVNCRLPRPEPRQETPP